MKKRFMTVAALMFAMGCNLGGGTTVYYPSSRTKKTTVVVEEYQEPQVVQETVIVTEVYEYPVCDPFFEEYEMPYYHTPEHCTDYGHGVGYCCTWAFGYGECVSEWCFWEDVCQWENTLDECYHDDSDYYYEYY